ncbi:hypothetical protein LPB67_10765 [Undibacterium sp. Jales W-56]|uniref:hypothetical protein n=1 Tax=Undibacterium sp. Jales W-56 TaxID=2897325 RepID=UPI0021CF0F66|nr:hypothetical protein [Undibacterium sp. Jales W-56]MCU6434252.1 hypothetical protein [Undibacterium sp. Jales W-56]
MKAILLTVVASLPLLACSTNELASNETVKEEAVYMTGSNIPKKKSAAAGVRTMDAESIEDARRLANPAANKGG